MKPKLAAGRLEPDQSTTGKDKAPPTHIDGSYDGARVAGQLVGQPILFLAGPFVEGHDSRTVAGHAPRIHRWASGRTAADEHDQVLSLDDRRAADAKEILHNAVFLSRVDF